MSYVDDYWSERKNLAFKAGKHTSQMDESYFSEIQYSIVNTVEFTDSVNVNHDVVKDTEIIVDDIDSVSAIFRHSKDKTAILNFASYKEAGGLFFKGSKAQEECLCHSSFLYNVLREKKDYYEFNNKHKNKGLYTNRALYSPNIRFLIDADSKNGTEFSFNGLLCSLQKLSIFADVITCAAPNKTTAQAYCYVSNRENSRVLDSRIKFVLDIAEFQNVNTLILGAYGCGVFGQSSTEVAQIFKKYLITTHKCFDRVVFAIPKGDNENYDNFRSVFERTENKY